MCFLAALRFIRPEFWRSFNEMWRSGDESRVKPWLTDHHIKDPWLRMALFQTMFAWEQDPDGPNARVDDEYLWFHYDALGMNNFPDFKPKLIDPFPTFSYDSNIPRTALFTQPFKQVRQMISAHKTEPLDSFERRMTAQFTRQLKQYTNRLTGMMNYGTNPERWRDAKWTALVFTGETRAAIARGLRKYDDAENAVARAVTRFAKAIDLSLPRR
jgi:hypothetical protein